MRVQIFGERCSGTNYLEDLLTLNCPGVTVTDAYGHKHMFNLFKKRRSPDNDGVYIFMYRNPYDWLRSLAQTPHHTQLWNLPFSQFIRTSPWVCDYYDGPRFQGEYGKIIERIDGNVIDLRNSKNALFEKLWLPGRSISLRYEDLRRDPQSTLKNIGDALGFGVRQDFTNVTTTKKAESGKYEKKEYQRISQSDLDFINKGLDWRLETQIGYHRIRTADTLDVVLRSLYD